MLIIEEKGRNKKNKSKLEVVKYKTKKTKNERCDAYVV